MRPRMWPVAAAVVVAALAAVSAVEANDELHPGARLFYPLWDVSTPNRLTFVVVTREALREDATIVSTPSGTFLGGIGTIINRLTVLGSSGNCLPRGAGGSSTNINRTDLGGTSTDPVLVDNLHFQYYGRSCTSANEVVHMSCADTDLFLLASPDNPVLQPRSAFAAVAHEGRGALDAHLIVNGTGGPSARKAENSLMGHAVISDLAEGWAATYPAAAAKATVCPTCATAVGGTEVGYENYPMEVFLPFALADTFPAPGGALRNVLALWGPGLFAAGNLSDRSIVIDFKWWDGRERAFGGSIGAHAIIRPLGGPSLPGLDVPLDSSRFTAANFVCGHDPTGTRAENDGFPRAEGSDATACGPPVAPDSAHPSDNFQASGDPATQGHGIQTSTPIGWWRFRLLRDGGAPIMGGVHSGRGLVGVVLSHTAGASSAGVADATRLWHKEACERAQSGQTIGPPHLRDGGVWANAAGSLTSGDLIGLFNIFSLDNQREICAGLFSGL